MYKVLKSSLLLAKIDSRLFLLVLQIVLSERIQISTLFSSNSTDNFWHVKLSSNFDTKLSTGVHFKTI